MAGNTNLNRTPSSAGNRRTWTFSAWVKRSSLSTGNQVLFQGMTGGFPEKIQFTSSDRLEYDHDIAGTDYTIYSSAQFRDVNSWYHIVVAKDTTQATETDRIKFWVNNVQLAMTEEALGYPGQNYEGQINNNVEHCLGSNTNGGEFFEGSMSHVHFVDGTALTPSSFGSTDSTSGEWKINTNPSVTYGTNGFFMFKDDNSLNDDSGNSNNFAKEAGELIKTEDCPSNVFATINPHTRYYSALAALEYGNLQVAGSTDGGAKWYGCSTLGFTKGKFYCEILNKTTSNPSLAVGISMNPRENSYQNHAPGARNSDIATENYSGNIVINNTNVVTGYGSTWSANNDICMLAVDADNDKFYIGKNGVWADSDNPSSNTGGYDMSSVANHAESTPFYFFSFGSTSGTYMNSFSVNFGNGFFGITAVSSAGSNASGLGTFEYDVPTGFTALCTKGLNE